MSVQARNNVTISGNGPATLVFAHGLGCDQTMWGRLAPAFESRVRIVTYDLTGAGGSDLGAYDRQKYRSLDGHAADLVEIVEAFAQGPTIMVSHSVSAMISLLAAIARPALFTAQVMVGPSPCYISADRYVGGFSRADIDDLLETLEQNYLGWSSAMAPVIMGAPQEPELGVELTNSFCRTDPKIALQFARATFTSDNRADLPKVTARTLILQCRDDIIAGESVGAYVHGHIAGSKLVLLNATGHCPNLSAPAEVTKAILEFI